MGFTKSGHRRLHTKEKEGRSRAAAWPRESQHAATKRVHSQVLSSSEDLEEMGRGEAETREMLSARA